MNVYPIELLAQYAPLMFVAGLTEGNQAPQSPSSSSPTNSNKTHSPIESPQLMSEGSSLSGKSDDPFESLIARLCAILVRRRKDTVWDTERDGSFQAILVKKNILIPPPKVQPTFLRRYGPPLVPNYGDTHSPLSPLTPSSPLYPDGLISPVWIRKHVELIPSVFMLFLRLSEMPTMALSLEGRQEAGQEARKRDAELVMEILQRKKSTSERGIKLIIVLLTSRRMLEDLSLDARLSFIRRQSSLDARQSLFVLTPVSDSELLDFVKNLQSVVYGAANNYYAAHSARVQRKRRIQPRANANEDLREIGWIMRYEYKLALFAEFRMEVELARKHYEDCWLALEEMFGSTAILPPRTKRWVEAKLTADCVAFKVSTASSVQKQLANITKALQIVPLL
ncbi:hypothetical protein FRC02_010860 [Tulasnella sp. 418]|nr:hypothetical protein FRC02_010860 [Tulasnella sp. 418]